MTEGINLQGWSIHTDSELGYLGQIMVPNIERGNFTGRV